MAASKEATKKAVLRIAEAMISIHGLKDTPREYILKCKNGREFLAATEKKGGTKNEI